MWTNIVCVSSNTYRAVRDTRITVWLESFPENITPIFYRLIDSIYLSIYPIDVFSRLTYLGHDLTPVGGHGGATVAYEVQEWLQPV
jgi:hypothetical protein